MDLRDLIFDEEKIQENLPSFRSSRRVSIQDEFFTPSAVLFTIIPFEEKPYELVLIKRTDRGLKHRGEMSFPGGKVDPKDRSLRDTALRELEEETGVPRENVNMLGCLNDFPTLTRYIITGFVGTIPRDQEFQKEDGEVEEIVRIPIDFFINKNNFKERGFNIDGKKFPIFYFNFVNPATGKKYTVWGATAHLIVSFIERVYEMHMSSLNVKRFRVDEIKRIKDYIKFKDKITPSLK